jgi:beta-N-acetylhexosaminidase
MDLWHARPCALGAEIAERIPGAIDVPVSYPLSRSQHAAVLRAARRAEVIVIGTLNAAMDPSQLALIERLRRETAARIVVAALRGPYDVLRIAPIHAIVCSYSSSAPSLQALAEVLCGEQIARGALPVSLPIARHVPAVQARRTSA